MPIVRRARWRAAEGQVPGSGLRPRGSEDPGLRPATPRPPLFSPSFSRLSLLYQTRQEESHPQTNKHALALPVRVALRIRLALPRRPKAGVSPSLRSRRRRRLRVRDSTKVTQQSQRPSSVPQTPGPKPTFPKAPSARGFPERENFGDQLLHFQRGPAWAQFNLRRRTGVAGNAPGSEGFPDPPPPTPRGPAARGGPGSAPPRESAAAAPLLSGSRPLPSPSAPILRVGETADRAASRGWRSSGGDAPDSVLGWPVPGGAGPAPSALPGQARGGRRDASRSGRRA